MAMRCHPTSLLVAPGDGDLAPDAPPSLSFARQPEWLSRWHPAEWAPHAEVASAALEQARLALEQPYDCLEACSLGGDLLMMQPAGPARELVSIARAPPPAAPGAVAPSPATTPGCYRPHYARAAGAVLQLALNSRAPAGWDSALWHSNLPVLAARSLHTLTLLQLRPPAAREEASGEEGVSGADTVDWTLRRVASYEVGGASAHVAWGRRVTQHGVVMRQDASLMEFSLPHGEGRATGSVLVPAWTARPGGEVAARLAQRRPGVLRCAFTARHPRRMALALRDSLALVDLASGGADIVFACDPGQHLTALAVPADSSDAGVEHEHFLAASTSAQVLLFDLRRPQLPLATWHHGLVAPPAHSARGAVERSCGGGAPDLLCWLPGGGLLASSSNSGRGIVCEWRPSFELGGSGTATLAAAPGRIWAVPGNGGGDAMAVAAGAQAEEAAPRFQWRPLGASAVTAVEPPLLLYSYSPLHPPELAEAQERAHAAHQLERRGLHSKEEQEEQQQEEEQEAGMEGEERSGEEAEGAGAQPQRRRGSSAPGGASGGDPGAPRRVKLLRQPYRGPLTLGAAAVQADWATGARLPTPALATLSYTGDVVIAALTLNRVPDQARPEPARGASEAGSAQLAPAMAVLLPAAAQGAEALACDAAAPSPEVALVPTLHKPLRVCLPLTRWLMDEVILQYRQRYTDPARHRQDHPDAAALRALPGVLARAREQGVSVTAWEAHAAAVAEEVTGPDPSSQPQEERAQVVPAAVPTLVAKQQQRAIAAAREASNPAARLERELRRAGILPFPPGVTSSPTDAAGPDLEAEARAAGWRCTVPLLPTEEFEARFAAAGEESGSAPWRAWELQYRPPLARPALAAAAAAAGRPPAEGGSVAGVLPLPPVQRAKTAAGGQLVLHPVTAVAAAAVASEEASTSAAAAAAATVYGVSIGVKQRKQPSAQARAALDALRAEWPL